MATATAQDETIDEVPGVRFVTDARPDSAQDVQLRRLRDELSGQPEHLPSKTTLPQLAWAPVATPGGPSYTIVTLWVPAQLRSDAVAKLEAAGFAVS